jgi:hypothetical protein
MRRRVFLTSAFAVPAFAQGKGKGKGKSKNAAPGFDTEERQVILGYYGPKFSNLPPGQQKQLLRKGTLPPGIAKKLQPFPPELQQRLPPLPPDCGCRRAVVDQWAVLVSDATNTVLDIIDLAHR